MPHSIVLICVHHKKAGLPKHSYLKCALTLCLHFCNWHLASLEKSGKGLKRLWSFSLLDSLLSELMANY